MKCGKCNSMTTGGNVGWVRDGHDMNVDKKPPRPEVKKAPPTKRPVKRVNPFK